MEEHRYTGPPLCNPNGEIIGTHMGWLQDQDEQVQVALDQIRNPLPMDNLDRVYFPYPTRLVMEDGTILTGCFEGAATALMPEQQIVRPILCQWDGPDFHWIMVFIHIDGRMRAEVHRNPPEAGQEFRKRLPVVTPPKSPLHGLATKTWTRLRARGRGLKRWAYLNQLGNYGLPL